MKARIEKSVDRVVKKEKIRKKGIMEQTLDSNKLQSSYSLFCSFN